MKSKIICTLAVIILLCQGLLFAAGTKEQSEESAIIPTAQYEEISQFEPITIIDGLGRTVTIDKKVERIGFTHFSTAEALKILDAWEMVVGRDSYTSDTIIYPRLDEIPPIVPFGKPNEPNYELVFSLGIDLVIVNFGSMSGMEEMIDTLEPDVKVVALQFAVPQTFCENIEKLGKLLDRETEAASYIDWYENFTNTLAQKTINLTDSEKPGILYKTGWGKAEELMTMTDVYQWSSERNRLTGCVNMAADLSAPGGWVQSIDQEWLVSQDIDVLVIGDPVPEGFGSHIDDNSAIVQHRKKVMDLLVFSGNDAVKNNKVYMLAASFFGTPRYIVGYAYMAKWFHPDLFNDLNPMAIHQEYISKFLRVDLDLSKHGVFVYPEE